MDNKVIVWDGLFVVSFVCTVSHNFTNLWTHVDKRNFCRVSVMVWEGNNYHWEVAVVVVSLHTYLCPFLFVSVPLRCKSAELEVYLSGNNTVLGKRLIILNNLSLVLAKIISAFFDVMWRYGIGMVYYKQEKFVLAEFHFNKALVINPFNSTLLCTIAVVRFIFYLSIFLYFSLSFFLSLQQSSSDQSMQLYAALYHCCGAFYSHTICFSLCT